MKLLWAETAWEDYLWWQANDPKGLARLNDVIRDTKRRPFVGIGKPEALKGSLSGWWSRRIDREHRFVYRVRGQGETQTLEIAQCRFHY